MRSSILHRFFKNTAYRQLILFVIVALTFGSASPAIANAGPANNLTPVVLFPGMFGSLLQVQVDHQTAYPECPASGNFVFWSSDTPFSESCQYKLVTLIYNADSHKPFPQRFSSPRGVKVILPDYGKVENSPFYENFYTGLEAAGYQRNKNIRVAGYDARLSPDMGGFLERTVALIEETYRLNNNTRVHLVGHSNGPIYAQYLLTHTSQDWKDKYIHGYTPIAGNFPGQGWGYSTLFIGTGFTTDVDLARTSAAMWASWPATYITSSDTKIIGNKEVVIRDKSTGKSYTPKDYRKLLKDAGLGRLMDIADYYIGFTKFAERESFPNVDVYAEIGAGLDTMVGVELPNLQAGQLLSPSPVWIYLPGDSNQEDLTNYSVQVWQKMKCYHFELNVNPGVAHGDLPSYPAVLARLLADLKLPVSKCSRESQ